MAEPLTARLTNKTDAGKTFFENGAAAFERSPRPRRMDLGNAKVEQLEARLKKKDEVIAAVTEELVRTKKELGED